ncbi:heparanase-like protein 2 [Andrographis paniculata]|uniref:heparanase-like protein 2 n=1 Tax=Andrographis paniculata TaxID=175694 RepID=UPI0021E9664E|nr:heparanase-like protein 2 [Andrographis paniculata]XP_051115612.1 heparanase-like protein 2 [Andrographis paniculata]XP_051115613.1 heparanase-like protein 2 [Andrographis paniculata]XP_051115614.1 heparanase-like protein 2 [Andrographis paniculata]XP_051115616.1 heparanase-like protein 2 [Andrographis paniculata]XP_051115617.1 heparanase-like protein 2 [Andrographis paniculata]XP_051115618.1 heparanase-like protein 2 [Andrographis paniculata]
MGFRLQIRSSILVFFVLVPAILAHKSEKTSLVVDTNATVAETDANYICATLDWWPPEKCNYGNCPWGLSSVINLNLSHPILTNAIRAFESLRIRIGGSLEDRIIYNVGNPPPYCPELKKQNSEMFGFSEGCLHMERWDELNNFFEKTGAVVTFSLNALYGRRHMQNDDWQGNWDSTNARDFINYTVSKGYKIDSWEFGNELSGHGVSARVGSKQYGKDMIQLKALNDELYAKSESIPQLLAPGGFYEKLWFNNMLQASGPDVINGVTHHLYSLGGGNDGNLKNKILNPDFLNKVSSTFINLASTIRANGPWASAWVGESGGAYNSGAKGISDTFLYSFWYLDQLGMAAKLHTKVYCRQSFIGGFYGLLNTDTFLPTPDYYGALLWHRLMGKGVLAINNNVSRYLRAYAHCAKARDGVAILLINLNKKTTYYVDISSLNNIEPSIIEQKGVEKGSFSHVIKRSILWIGNKVPVDDLYREEYHLTPSGGNLQSRTVLLNGRPLRPNQQNGAIPDLAPVLKDIKSRVKIDPLSIKFVVHPYIDAPGCK